MRLLRWIDTTVQSRSLLFFGSTMSTWNTRIPESSWKIGLKVAESSWKMYFYRFVVPGLCLSLGILEVPAAKGWPDHVGLLMEKIGMTLPNVQMSMLKNVCLTA